MSQLEEYLIPMLWPCYESSLDAAVSRRDKAHVRDHIKESRVNRNHTVDTVCLDAFCSPVPTLQAIQFIPIRNEVDLEVEGRKVCLLTARTPKCQNGSI